MLDVIYITIMAFVFAASACLIYGEHTHNSIAVNIAEIIYIAAGGAALIGLEVWIISGM